MALWRCAKDLLNASAVVRLPSETLRECGHHFLPAMCRYCCKSPKLPGANFLAVKKKDRRPSIDVAPITLPRSPASLSSGNEVPQSRVYSQKNFLIKSAKRLLQQNLPGPDSCTATNRVIQSPRR